MTHITSLNLTQPLFSLASHETQPSLFFPPEIVSRFVSYADDRTRSSLSLVNRQWCQVTISQTRIEFYEFAEKILDMLPFSQLTSRKGVIDDMRAQMNQSASSLQKTRHAARTLTRSFSIFLNQNTMRSSYTLPEDSNLPSSFVGKLIRLWNTFISRPCRHINGLFLGYFASNNKERSPLLNQFPLPTQATAFSAHQLNLLSIHEHKKALSSPCTIDECACPVQTAWIVTHTIYQQGLENTVLLSKSIQEPNRSLCLKTCALFSIANGEVKKSIDIAGIIYDSHIRDRTLKSVARSALVRRDPLRAMQAAEMMVDPKKRMKALYLAKKSLGLAPMILKDVQTAQGSSAPMNPQPVSQLSQQSNFIHQIAIHFLLCGDWEVSQQKALSIPSPHIKALTLNKIANLLCAAGKTTEAIKVTQSMTSDLDQMFVVSKVIRQLSQAGKVSAAFSTAQDFPISLEAYTPAPPPFPFIDDIFHLLPAKSANEAFAITKNEAALCSSGTPLIASNLLAEGNLKETKHCISTMSSVDRCPSELLYALLLSDDIDVALQLVNKISYEKLKLWFFREILDFFLAQGKLEKLLELEKAMPEGLCKELAKHCLKT